MPENKKKLSVTQDNRHVFLNKWQKNKQKMLKNYKQPTACHVKLIKKKTKKNKLK